MKMDNGLTSYDNKLGPTTSAATSLGRSMNPCSNTLRMVETRSMTANTLIFCPNSGPSTESQKCSPKQSRKTPAAPASPCQWPPTRACLQLRFSLDSFPGTNFCLRLCKSRVVADSLAIASSDWTACLFSFLSGLYFHNSNVRQQNTCDTVTYYWIREQTTATSMNWKKKGQKIRVSSFNFLKCLKSKRKIRYSPGLNRLAELGLIQRVAGSLLTLPDPSPPGRVKLEDQRWRPRVLLSLFWDCAVLGMRAAFRSPSFTWVLQSPLTPHPGPYVSSSPRLPVCVASLTHGSCR